MEVVRKRKTTKMNFEADLIERWGVKSLTYRPHYEDSKKISLYYADGVHIGTWQSGDGWEFQERRVFQTGSYCYNSHELRKRNGAYQ